MDDYRDEEDDLGPARGIMNAMAMAMAIFLVIALLASCAVGWS